MKLTKMAAVVALTALCAGCLKQDSTVTWFVEPGGQVTWSILEKDVRSDAQAASDREIEETQYVSTVRSNAHPAAMGLTRLGASGLKVTLIHDRAPFTVLTEGGFSGLDELGRRMIMRFGLSGQSDIVRDGDTWTWNLTVSDPNTSNGDDADGAEFAALMGDRLQVALRRGHFISATGFALDDERRIATLIDKKDESSPAAGTDGVLRVSLSWEIK